MKTELVLRIYGYPLEVITGEENLLSTYITNLQGSVLSNPGVVIQTSFGLREKVWLCQEAPKDTEIEFLFLFENISWWNALSGKSQTQETAATVPHVCPYRRNVMISLWNVLSFSGFCFDGRNVTFLKSKAHSWLFSLPLLPNFAYKSIFPSPAMCFSQPVRYRSHVSSTTIWC